MTTIADGELSSLALCWRLERADGAGIALTSHDRELTIDGATHVPTPGILPAAITRSLGLEPNSSEVSGALSTDALDPADLSLGRWDSARAELAAVDWRDPQAAGIELLSGELGNVSIAGDGFTAELEGAAAKLEGPICPSTSAECRAQFGDKACRVDLSGRTLKAIVTSADEGVLTLDHQVGTDYVLGRLRYLSGGNCGLAAVVLSAEGNEIRVRDVPRAAVDPGTRVELREGCDKRFQTCAERFANAENFRGEPHLPGNDLLTRYPGV